MVVGNQKMGWGFAGCMFCYCVISTIVALGTLFLTVWIPFLQLSFDSYPSPDDAMISPFGAFSWTLDRLCLNLCVQIELFEHFFGILRGYEFSSFSRCVLQEYAAVLQHSSRNPLSNFGDEPNTFWCKRIQSAKASAFCRSMFLKPESNQIAHFSSRERLQVNDIDWTYSV